jgi:hypothetical protein
MRDSSLVLLIVSIGIITFGVFLLTPQGNSTSAAMLFLFIGVILLIITIMMEKREYFEYPTRGKPPSYASKYPAFTENDLPFKGKARVRSGSYNRLVGRWMEVDVSDTWEKIREELEKAFRQQYGFFVTTSGKKVRRWTDETWKTVRRDIYFEKKEGPEGGPQPA